VPDYDGYGFNVRADRQRQGQFISNVEGGSPADVAGLREGDRIVEVNGEGVDNDSHSQVKFIDSFS